MQDQFNDLLACKRQRFWLAGWGFAEEPPVAWKVEQVHNTQVIDAHHYETNIELRVDNASSLGLMQKIAQADEAGPVLLKLLHISQKRVPALRSLPGHNVQVARILR